MTSLRQSDILFKRFFHVWKLTGLWFGRNPTKMHTYIACINILFNQVLFNIFLTLSLWHTPRRMEYMVSEVVFYFTEIAVTSKVFMIILKREKILEAFNMMDGENLDGDDETSKKIIEKDNSDYSTMWKFFNIVSHLAYSCLAFVPIIVHVFFHAELKTVISQFYFLSDESRREYIYYIFFYQTVVIYVHMNYNITIDAFVAGLMLTGVTQLKILNRKLKNSMKLSDEENLLSFKEQDDIQTTRFRKLLLRYGLVLKYCSLVQDIVSFNIFVVFGLGSLIIGVVLCQLLLPTSIGLYLSMFNYLVAMLLQIFLPAYWGSALSYESNELVLAAYYMEWIPRSETFKRSMRIFVERAKRPIQITGLKIFTMSLFTFTSIIKTAYSFFALIRRFQDE